jgi:hypothetical protein
VGAGEGVREQGGVGDEVGVGEDRGKEGSGLNLGGGMDEAHFPGGCESFGGGLGGNVGMAYLGDGTVETTILGLIDLRYCCLKERRLRSDSG